MIWWGIIMLSKAMYGFSQYDKMKHLSLNRLVIAFLLIFIGVASRIWLHRFLPPAPHVYINLAGTKQPIFIPADVFFMIAAISLVAGRYLGNYYSFFVPFSIMLITDVFIGNNYIFLFTWSGFAILGCMGYLMQSKNFGKFILYSIPSILVYDIWTNFGWWLGGYYGYSLHGFILCYLMAIPFTIWHLISTTAILPLFAIPFEKIELIKEKSVIGRYATISSTALLMVFSLLLLLE